MLMALLLKSWRIRRSIFRDRPQRPSHTWGVDRLAQHIGARTDQALHSTTAFQVPRSQYRTLIIDNRQAHIKIEAGA